MKKSGFTLAEVLITLGIIGVVAALTAPALVANGRNEANAAKLSVAVSNFENALQNMMIRENVELVSQTKAWTEGLNNRATFAGYLGQYLHINGFKDLNGPAGVNTYYGDSIPCYMTANGSRDEHHPSAQHMGATPNNQRGLNHIIETKSGATIFIVISGHANVTQEQKQRIIEQGGALFNEAAVVTIDVNGKSAPNTMGRDMFMFYLGDNGILYPYGGLDVSVYDNHGSNNTWDQAGAVDLARCITGNIDSGSGCTARVIEEGYKINY